MAAGTPRSEPWRSRSSAATGMPTERSTTATPPRPQSATEDSDYLNDRMTARRAIDLPFAETLAQGTPEERDLALAFKRGEPGAYDTIHERFEARVRSVCKRMLGNADDAEEAAQEAFIRVYRALPRLNGGYRLDAWIVRIATNVCLDVLRSRSRHPSHPAPVEVLDLESPPIETSDPELLYLRGAEGRRVRKVLGSLPPLHRAAIVLRDFEGVSYAEIAETLGISEARVKALLHRARRRFRRSWQSNVASVFAPLSLLKRLFGKTSAVREKHEGGLSVVSQTAEMAVSQGQQVAASSGIAAHPCSTAIQQCSQIVTDRAVPMVAALVVGTASLGAAVTTRQIDSPYGTPGRHRDAVAHPREAQQAKTPGAASEPNGKAPTIVAPAPSQAVPEPTDSADEATVPADPVPEPTPTPSPTVSPSDENDSQVTPEPTPPPVPEPPSPPPPFSAAVGFDHGSEIPQSEPTKNAAKINCVSNSFKQLLETTISDGSAAHMGLLQLRAGKTTGRLELTIIAGQSSFSYSSWGAEPVATWSRSDKTADLKISGSFGALRGSHPENAGLPRSGTFLVNLTMDCTIPSLITERVTFTAH
jgi:RNA polymerase sigma-70 factor (ECF subfamily)